MEIMAPVCGIRIHGNGIIFNHYSLMYFLDTSSYKRVQILVGEEFFVQPNETLVTELTQLLGEAKFSLVM